MTTVRSVRAQSGSTLQDKNNSTEVTTHIDLRNIAPPQEWIDTLHGTNPLVNEPQTHGAGPDDEPVAQHPNQTTGTRGNHPCETARLLETTNTNHCETHSLIQEIALPVPADAIRPPNDRHLVAPLTRRQPRARWVDGHEFIVIEDADPSDPP